MYSSTPILLGKSDFQILSEYIRQHPAGTPDSMTLLSYELSEAIVVEDEILPQHCVCLNSKVKIKEWPSNRVLEFSIVIPEQEDEQKKRISVLNPWGASFIGLSKTEKIEREIGGDTRCFEILDVIQNPGS